MRLLHDRSARGLVAAARLHADVAILDQIEAADAVLAANTVELGERLRRSHRFAVDRDDVTVRIFELEIFCRVGCFFGRRRPPPHIVFGLQRGIFQRPSFVADVQQIGVHRIRAAAGLVLHFDGDAVFRGVFEQFFARGKIPFPPRRDHTDVRLERVISELEADLIVALSGGAVRDRVGIGFARDFDLPLGDQRPRDRRSEQVFAFVDGVRAEHRVNEIADEFLAQVVNVDLGDAGGFGLGARRFELLALADVGGEGHHLAPISVLQPFEDHRSIEAAGVRQHCFVDGAWHTGQSILAPVLRMTGAHLSDSLLISVAKSSELPPTSSKPWALSVLFTDGSLRIALISVLRRCTIGRGVPAATRMPFHASASNPG